MPSLEATDGSPRKRAIIVDVDNTILSQDLRKREIARSLLGRTDIEAADIRRSYDLANLIPAGDADLQHRLAELLFSDVYSEAIEPITGASEVLQSVVGGFTILYVSSRPTNPQEKEAAVHLLEATLQRFAFPVARPEVEIHLMPHPGHFRSLADFEVQQQAFKIRIVAELQGRYDIVAVIGDTSTDLLAAAQNEVVGILFRNYFTLQQCAAVTAIAQAVNFEADDWWEIRRLLYRLARRRQDSLADLRKLLIDQYSSYLDDLDFKNYLNLLIATVLFGVEVTILFTSAIGRERWLPNKSVHLDGGFLWLSASAGLCIVTVIFSVWSFTSRSRSPHRLKVLWLPPIRKRYFLLSGLLLLFGLEWAWPATPPRDALVNTSSSEQARRRRHLAFFRSQYGSVDPDVIANQLLLNLRSINYAKIYPEYLARCCLLLAIAAFVVAMAFLLFPFSHPTAPPAYEGLETWGAQPY